MAIIRTELSLEALTDRLSKARGTRLVIYEAREGHGLDVQFACITTDLAEAGFRILEAAEEFDIQAPGNVCPTCAERRRRVALALAILGAPMDQGHVH